MGKPYVDEFTDFWQKMNLLEKVFFIVTASPVYLRLILEEKPRLFGWLFITVVIVMIAIVGGHLQVFG